jgi:hypothetical protein
MMSGICIPRAIVAALPTRLSGAFLPFLDSLSLDVTGDRKEESLAKDAKPAKKKRQEETPG